MPPRQVATDGAITTPCIFLRVREGCPDDVSQWWAEVRTLSRRAPGRRPSEQCPVPNCRGGAKDVAGDVATQANVVAGETRGVSRRLDAIGDRPERVGHFPSSAPDPVANRSACLRLTTWRPASVCPTGHPASSWPTRADGRPTSLDARPSVLRAVCRGPGTRSTTAWRRRSVRRRRSR